MFEGSYWHTQKVRTLSEYILTLTRATEKSKAAGGGTARRVIIECGTPVTNNLMNLFDTIAESISGIEVVVKGEMRGLIVVVIEAGRATNKIADAFIAAVHDRVSGLDEEELTKLLTDTSAEAMAVDSSSLWPFDASY